jgi:uncharacterized coiled-coil DUF342 family protein
MFNLFVYIATLANEMRRNPQPAYNQTSLADACFHATEGFNENRDKYEVLAEERRKLKRQLKEMGEENTQSSSKAKDIKERIDQINAILC